MNRDRKLLTFHPFDKFFTAADLHLNFCPNFFARFALTYQSPVGGPRHKHRPNQVPTPQSNSIQISQPAPVTPVRRSGKIAGKVLIVGAPDMG